MPRRFLADGRNPTRWSLNDRRRKCDAAGVSPAWPTNPFGNTGIPVFPLIQPGVFRVNGLPVEQASGFNQALGRVVDACGWTLRDEKGDDVLLWKFRQDDGKIQTTTALDLLHEPTRATFVELVSAHFPWAAGIWLDYYTTLSDQFPNAPAGFWPAWNDALADVVARCRAARPGWKLLGQIHQETPITPLVDGCFREEHPQHFGVTLAQHATFLKAAGSRAPNYVFEIRSGWDVPKKEAANGITAIQWMGYVKTCLRWMEERNVYVSFGRDANALVGLP